MSKKNKTTAINHWDYVDNHLLSLVDNEFLNLMEEFGREKQTPQKPNTQPLPDDYKPLCMYDYVRVEHFTFTQTQKTKIGYIKRALSLIKRFNNDRHARLIQKSPQFIYWLLIRKQIIAKSTWKSDRAALIYYFRTIKNETLLTLLKHTNNKSGKTQNKKRLRLEKRTSEKKLKHVKTDDFSKLIKYHSANQNGYWQDIAVNMFIVMYFTGIRPIEITQSRVTYIKDDSGSTIPVLKVRNAKFTNGRSNGIHRTIPLNKIDATIVEYIKHGVERASTPTIKSGKEITPEAYVKRASEAFRRLVKKVFPKRKNNICPYSSRHQFTADAKDSGLHSTEIAALLGHISDRTSYTHYARPCHASSSKRIPKPLTQEVLTVREKLRSPFHQSPSPKEAITGREGKPPTCRP